MESNFEGESICDFSPGKVSTDEASRALAVLESDQVAIRTAAALPRWYLLIASVCLGFVTATFAIPESWSWWAVVIAGLLDVIIIVLLMWKIKRKPVQMEFWALFKPRRTGMIPVIGWLIVIFLVMLVAAYFHGILPWWMFICGGLAEAIFTYLIMNWAWRSWARMRP